MQLVTIIAASGYRGHYRGGSIYVDENETHDLFRKRIAYDAAAFALLSEEAKAAVYAAANSDHPVDIAAYLNPYSESRFALYPD